MIAERRRLKLASRRLLKLAPRGVAARRGPADPPRSRSHAPKRGRRLRRRRRMLPARARLTVAGLLVVIAALAGGWLWLCDSSLVSVEHVIVTGADGPDAGQISVALTAAARRMTTLDVDLRRLRAAVSGYPVVADLRVSTQLPHRMRIRVVERLPLAAVTVDGRQTAVSGDGTLLPELAVGSLPALAGGASARNGRLTGADAQEVALLAAAPYPLISRISQVSEDPTHGLTAQLRGGPSLYFGDGGELRAKWIAASEVLADSGSAGAAYIDVSDPHRPAAGMGSDQAGASQTAAASTAGSQTAAAASQTGASQPAAAPSTGASQAPTPAPVGSSPGG